MNQGQFKDPVCHMCLAGTAVAYWSLTQEIVGSSPSAVMTNIFVAEFSELKETFRENSIDSLLIFRAKVFSSKLN